MINDRGPFAGRIIDLSKAAAGVIGMMGKGIARVTVRCSAARTFATHRRPNGGCQPGIRRFARPLRHQAVNGALFERCWRASAMQGSAPSPNRLTAVRHRGWTLLLSSGGRSL
jgi:rare lipoprotein A (peptidoglycan hydrolase)